MKKQSAKNLIWIVLDGMRSAKDGHEKARFISFDVAAKRGALFQRVIAPAPSTMMSLFSFITGINSYAILPDFFSSIMSNAIDGNIAHTGDTLVTFDRKVYPTLLDKMANVSARMTCSAYYPPLRSFMRGLGVSTKLEKDSHVNLNYSIEWSNREVFEHAKEMFTNNQTDQRFFALIVYVVRKDIDTIFSDTITLLDNKNFFNDSILLFCPDHGFYAGSFEAQATKRSLQHDADAGVESLVSLGALIGSGIKPQVQSENIWGPDLLFTAFDLAGMLSEELKGRYKYGAISYGDQIRMGKRIHTHGRVLRSDTRFVKQPGGVSVIIKDDFIWRFDHSTGESNIANWDFDERRGVREWKVNNSQYIGLVEEEFKKDFEDTQKFLLSAGSVALKNYNPLAMLRANFLGDLVHQFEGHTYKHTLGVRPTDAKVLVFRSFGLESFKMTSKVLRDYFTPRLVDVICDNMSIPIVNLSGFNPFCYGEGFVQKDSLKSKYPELFQRNYDVAFIGYNLTPLEGYANIFDILRELNCQHAYFINANGCLYEIADSDKSLLEIEELKKLRQRYQELFYKYGRSNAL